MFNFTRFFWNGIINYSREEENYGVHIVIFWCLFFIIFIAIPLDIILLPLDIIIYIAIKTDKNKKKRK